MLAKQKKLLRMVRMAVTVIILAVAVLLVYKSQHTSFADGFSDIQEIEAKYNGNFKQEKVNDTSIQLGDFDNLIKELEDYNRELFGKSNTTDAQALINFIKARIAMLKSEKFFKLGYQIGGIGMATDAGGFRCSEMNYLLNAAYYFNRSWSYGVESLQGLDDLLSQYKSVPQLHDLVGIDEGKTTFYKSDLRVVKHFSLDNILSLEYYCGYKGGAPDSLKPFEKVKAPAKNTRVVPVNSNSVPVISG